VDLLLTSAYSDRSATFPFLLSCLLGPLVGVCDCPTTYLPIEGISDKAKEASANGLKGQSLISVVILGLEALFMPNLFTKKRQLQGHPPLID
jgi:hypothetical protein